VNRALCGTKSEVLNKGSIFTASSGLCTQDISFGRHVIFSELLVVSSYIFDFKFAQTAV
jgi:hypothetical protein